MTNPPSPLDIAHDPRLGRFSTRVEGQLCVLDYQLAGTLMVVVYTGVPAPVAGRGIAAALVRAAMDEARRRHWKVRPQCSYADLWLQRHPDYQDLRA